MLKTTVELQECGLGAHGAWSRSQAAFPGGHAAAKLSSLSRFPQSGMKNEGVHTTPSEPPTESSMHAVSVSCCLRHGSCRPWSNEVSWPRHG